MGEVQLPRLAGEREVDAARVESAVLSEVEQDRGLPLAWDDDRNGPPQRDPLRLPTLAVPGPRLGVEEAPPCVLDVESCEVEEREVADRADRDDALSTVECVAAEREELELRVVRTREPRTDDILRVPLFDVERPLMVRERLGEHEPHPAVLAVHADLHDLLELLDEEVRVLCPCHPRVPRSFGSLVPRCSGRAWHTLHPANA